MKHTRIIAAAAILITAFVPYASLTHGDAMASAKAPVKGAGFEGSAAWAKADLRLREAWRGASEKGKGSERLECLMKTRMPIGANERALLKSAGFVVHTVIVTIATGDLAAKNLPAVASLDFVESMELAAPMSIKRKKD
ncbi:MAG: hypothetical protein V2A66_10620 [Pseudomonadota bacterium]